MRAYETTYNLCENSLSKPIWIDLFELSCLHKTYERPLREQLMTCS